MATHAAAQHHGEVINPSTGLGNRKLLMWAFLGSDVMFFGAFIGTYLIYRGQSLAGPYPKDILNIPITSISTFVLLMSSLGIVLALYYLKESRYALAKVWLFLVIAMGVTFLGFQVFEFNEFVHEGLTPRTNMFGTTFFILTGLHGAHVTLGVLWLSVLLFNEMKGALSTDNAIDLEVAGLYWHFVDIVWIVIFTVVYLISANDGGAPGSLPFTH